MNETHIEKELKLLKTIADSFYSSFVSPNVSDRNLEPANVVDCLAYIATSNQNIADALNRCAEALLVIAKK